MRIICDTIKVMQKMEVSISTKLDLWLVDSWKEGIDYEETFAPVARHTSIRAIMGLAAKLGWKLHQMDVETTFPNGMVKDEVYMEQSLGFKTHDRQSHVYRWKKYLDVLKKVWQD